jgi:ACS family glucarate transporter-like MFS transporter
VGLLTAASFVAYLLRQNMSVAGQQMMTDLGLTQVQLGIVLAAFAWGYAIFQLPGGILGQWLGGRRGLALIAVAWGGLNMLVGLAPGTGAASPVVVIASLAALRFLMGAAQAPLYPITSGVVIARWFPATGWALPNGLTNAGLTFGSAATGPLIAWLAMAVGWRGSFVLTGPLAFVLALAWWWYDRDRPDEHPGVTPAELRYIDAGRADSSDGPGVRFEWRRVLGDRDLLLVTLSYFFSNYVFYFFFNWLYIYLVDVRKFALLTGGMFAAAPWIAGAVGAVTGGAVCDRLSRRYGTLRGCQVVSMVGLVLAGFFIVAAGAAGSPYLAVVLLALCLASQQLTDSAAWAASTLVGGRQAAAACGVLNTGGNVVGGIGALLVPITARALGWPAALGTASVCALIGALLWVGVRTDRATAPPA